MKNSNKQYLDKKVVQSMTLQILMSIKASPKANVGAALGFGIAESVEQAVFLYVSEHWTEHTSHYPETQQHINQLAGTISLFINETMTRYYGDYSWQHVPEFPDL